MSKLFGARIEPSLKKLKELSGYRNIWRNLPTFAQFYGFTNDSSYTKIFLNLRSCLMVMFSKLREIGGLVMRLKQLYMVMIVVLFAFISANLIAERVVEVYNEDFTNNPGFISPQPDYCFWDSENGWYVATIRDVSTGRGNYYGFSPTFEPVGPYDHFRIEFDFSIIKPNWGNYPGIRFISSYDEILQRTYQLDFSFHWSDHVYKIFRFISSRDSDYRSPKSAIAKRWYRVSIEIFGTKELANLLVTDKITGEVFWQLNEVYFPIKDDITMFFIGMITIPPKYGSTSTIHVDNVRIEKILPCSYGPEIQPLEFVRGKGEPVLDTFSWVSCGGPGKAKFDYTNLSSSLVYLNGTIVANQDDFNGKTGTFEIPLNLFKGENVIQVELRSKPGSKLKISFNEIE